MTKDSIEDVYPLLPMQDGIVYHYLSAPSSGLYVVQAVYTIHGELNVEALQRSWADAIARHPALRSLFVLDKGKRGVQVVRRSVSVPWDERDLSALSPDRQREEAEKFLLEDRRAGFDLSRAPILRLTLIRYAPDRADLVWSVFHGLVDGWSMAVTLKEVFTSYASHARGEQPPAPEPAGPYRDYVTWYEGRGVAAGEEFWRDQMRGLDPAELVTERPAPSRDEAFAKLELSLPEDLSERLRSCAREQRLTLNSLVLGAWAHTLAGILGREDLVLGTTLSGRPTELPGVQSSVGLYINTVPFRVTLPEDQPLSVWLKSLQDRLLDVQEHQYLPLTRIHALSGLPRGAPLFHSLYIYENFPLDDVPIQLDDGVSVDGVRVSDWTHYALTLCVSPGKRMSLRLQYDRRLLAEEEVAAYGDRLRIVLEAMVASPGGDVRDLPGAEAEDERLPLAEWNDTAAEYPRELLLHELFERRVAETPDLTALVFRGRELTYRELDARANRLAHHLRALGVGPEVVVGLFLERSFEAVVAVLGVLKAGGAFLPLDPEYPPERTSFLLKDAGVPVVLVQSALADRLPEHEARTIVIDDDAELAGSDPVPVPRTASPDNLAYLIYTSGSTGRPKGVMNDHRAICNQILWMIEAYPLTTRDSMLLKTPSTFDVSVWELFWPLVSGAKLFVTRPGGHRDSGYLLDLIREHSVTTAHFVPSMLRVFLEEPEAARCASLERVICSGEAVAPELQDRFFSQMGAELINLYGPTEAAVHASEWRCEREAPRRSVVPIGRPVANTQLHVLDENMRPTPVGVAGELHIGGIQVARGYRNLPELTNEKFVPDPFREAANARLYRTGDLARFRPDGVIEYLGRNDDQLKIRGFRIEPGEIESVLERHESVRQAVVVAREASAHRQLVAYVAVAGGDAKHETELIDALRRRVPAYMVPSRFVFLERLPLLSNGKVDRHALPDPARTDPTKERTAPRSPVEETIAEVWKTVLDLDEVSVYDNFFDLGGDSLLAVKAIVKLEKKLGARIEPDEMAYETLGQLAAVYEGKRNPDSGGLVHKVFGLFGR